MKVRQITINKSRVIRLAQYVLPKVEAGMVIDIDEDDDVDAVVNECHNDINILLDRLESFERVAFKNKGGK